MMIVLECKSGQPKDPATTSHWWDQSKEPQPQTCTTQWWNCWLTINSDQLDECVSKNTENLSKHSAGTGFIQKRSAWVLIADYGSVNSKGRESTGGGVRKWQHKKTQRTVFQHNAVHPAAHRNVWRESRGQSKEPPATDMHHTVLKVTHLVKEEADVKQLGTVVHLQDNTLGSFSSSAECVACSSRSPPCPEPTYFYGQMTGFSGVGTCPHPEAWSAVISAIDQPWRSNREQYPMEAHCSMYFAKQ